MLNLLLFVSLLLWWSAAFASHYHSKQSTHLAENEIVDKNYQPDPIDSAASSVQSSVAYGSSPYSNHLDLHPPPSPFVKQQHESRHLSPHSHPSRSVLHPPPPGRRLRKDHPDKHLSLDGKTDFTRGGEGSGGGGGGGFSYILTAGGKEKIYDREGEIKFAPHAAPFISSPYAKKFAYDKSFKKYRFAYSNMGGRGNPPIVVGPSVSVGVGTASSSSSSSSSTISPDEHDIMSNHVNSMKDALAAAATASPDSAVSRTLNDFLHTASPNSIESSAHQKFFTEKTTDMFGSKGTMWKQLGPNVEISSAADHVPLSRQILPPSPKERKKSKASLQQQRKNGPKNLRTGYMTQQHALYVANNLKGLKGGTVVGIGVGNTFDHNNVLRQSDKFELTDAMVSEAEKEEALKNTKGIGRIRFKQDPPQQAGQLLAYVPSASSSLTDPYDPQSSVQQYYSNPPFSFVATHGSPVAFNAYTPYVSPFGKGFVRHIEIEMNGAAGGQRKMVPALIIPLGGDPSTSNIIPEDATGAGAASAYANSASVERLPKNSFPYDIVSPRYVHHAQSDTVNAISPSASAESYHLQPFAQLHYQYKTQLADESSYNPYASPHYHNSNLYNTRFAFINNNGATSTAGAAGGQGSLTTAAPPNVENTATNTNAVTDAAFDARPHRFSASIPGGTHSRGSSMAKKQKQSSSAQLMLAESSELKAVTVEPSASISTYVYDANNPMAGATAQHTYLSPSESTYFATMSSMREEVRPNRQPVASNNKHHEMSDMRRD